MILFFFRQLDEFDHIGSILLDFLDTFDLRRQKRPFAHQLLRGVSIIPEIGVFYAVIELSEACLCSIPVKDASSAAPPTA
ncbi:hypothetical protein JCM15831A_25330 [Asaia astilbis]